MTIIDTTPRIQRKRLATRLSQELGGAKIRLTGYDPYNCKCKCPGGHACCLSPDVYHTLHVCSDERCVCHSRQRYEGVRK